jgi:methyl-accepting chemotaxis protein
MRLVQIDWETGRKAMLYLKFMIYYVVTLAALAGVLTFAETLTYRGVLISAVDPDEAEGAKAELAKVMRTNIFLAVILFVLFLLMTGILFSRWITRPLKELTVAADTVAREGDLAKSVPIRSENEIGELAKAFNQMIYNLGSLVKHIQDGGMQIGLSSRDILVASEQQASGSTEQAASVAEISATIEELASTSKQIADSAGSVAEMAEQTLASARSGREAVGDSIEGMDRVRDATQEIAGKVLDLGQKSQAIGSIIEMIDSIADRTDLLALNAAIEAAKAGEAGKGFAVLAGEIRILSENVMESTKQIGELLTEIQGSINASAMAMEGGTKEVEKGVELAGKTGASLEEILNMIERTTTSAKQIMVSTRQQETASEQAVIAMKEIAEVSQQSAANAKRTTTIANRLASLSQDLEKAVEQFKIARQGKPSSDSGSEEVQEREILPASASD